jgi:glycosyltransferase involved in cell wall biosynthesis
MIFSIIMPAFNAEKTITKSIESTVKQTFDDWELIIINDGSTDSTLKIITSFQQLDSRIKLINLLNNKGLSNARNEGILNAKGDFITFLDSDDLWHKDKLKIQNDFHSRNPESKISHTDFNLIIGDEVTIRRFRFISKLVYKHSGNLFPQLIFKNPIGILTVCLKRELLNEVGVFDTNLWTFEDQDLWLRVSRKSNFSYITSVLASYRISTGGITSKTGKYKRAYKHFIKKHFETAQKYGLIEESLSVYHMYFGVQYYKSKNYFLSILYFQKSIFFTKNYLNKLIILYHLLFVLKDIVFHKVKESI